MGAGLGGMLARLAADSGLPREALEREFHALHQRHGTTEYAFAIQELPSLVALHPGEDLVARYAAAIDEYRTARRRTLRLYPRRRRGADGHPPPAASWAGYTESRAYYANYRIRALGLDGLLDCVYSPPDHALPGGVSPEEIRRYPAEHYELTRTVHRHTPEGAWKPDAAVLRAILAELGADPARAVYVGDSLVKDVAMARAAGVSDVVARYGDVPDRAGYELCVGSPTGRARWWPRPRAPTRPTSRRPTCSGALRRAPRPVRVHPVRVPRAPGGAV
jgi:phosphoglycolate phosphatase